MEEEKLKQLSAITALNDMMQRGHMNICTIESVAKMLGIDPKGRAHDILRPLHCVDFAKMPVELRGEIPGLIKECLGVEPIYQFEAPKLNGAVMADIPSATQPDEQRQLRRLLTGI